MDALAALVTLLKPQAVGTKIIHGAGRWGVCYPPFGQPSFALVIRGGCWISVDGLRPVTLQTGDFVFYPSMPAFTMAADSTVKPRHVVPSAVPGRTEEIYHGRSRTKSTAIILGGYFSFDSINAALLLDFLPTMLRIRSTDPAGHSIGALVSLIRREVDEARPGRDLVLTRLVEVMLVEALRSAPSHLTPTGLLAGLRDPRLARALHAIHTRPAHPWNLVSLAHTAGLSRSSFAERFASLMRSTPLHYLLRLRLGLAKSLLVHDGVTVAEAALAVGYESASGFSTAFSREVGLSPRQFADLHATAR